MARAWDSWTGNVTGPTMRKAREVVAAAARAGHPIRVVHGKVSDPSNSEHYSGRALDFMTFSDGRLSATDRSIGDWVAAYLWTNRKRLGLNWIIWRQRIRSTSPSKSGSWEAMADRGSPTNNHMDHVHAYFGTGAYRAPAGGTVPPASSTDTDWMDAMFKNVSEFKKAVLDAVAGDRYPAPAPALKGDPKNKYWTLFSYVRYTYENAQEANQTAQAALKEVRALRKALGK